MNIAKSIIEKRAEAGASELNQFYGGAAGWDLWSGDNSPISPEQQMLLRALKLPKGYSFENGEENPGNELYMNYSGTAEPEEEELLQGIRKQVANIVAPNGYINQG